MAEVYGREELPSLDQQKLLEGAVNIVLIETLLYGVHLVLYAISVYILLKRRKSTQLTLLVFVTIMFALTTGDIAISFRFVLCDLPAVRKHKMEPLVALMRSYPKTPLFITNNFIADILLVYRCYMIWGKRRYILIGSAIFVVADTVLGYMNTNGFLWNGIKAPLYFSTTFAINVVLTIATAGRIWWTARTIRPLLPKHRVHRYDVAFVVLIESGAIYSASLMVFMLGTPFTSSLPIRLVGIMPTLMIVQVELGKGVISEDVEDNSSQPRLSATAHLGSTIKNLRPVETSVSTPGALRAEIQLTTVTERFQDSLEPRVLVERPANAQQNPRDTVGR